MPDLRWYLKREGSDIALVVERRSDRRGYQYRFCAVTWSTKAEMRADLRASLRELERLVARLDEPALPVRTFSPEEVDG